MSATPLIPRHEQWGPFCLGLDRTERTARLRCLGALVHVYGHRGPDKASALSSLRAAEIDMAALSGAVDALNRLGSLDRRRVLAAYAAIDRWHRDQGGARHG